MLKKILFLTFAVFSINSMSAQKSARHLVITGCVLDLYSSPISNAMIIIDNHKTSSITDSRGNYKVKVKSGALKIGVFSFGNGLTEETIGGRTMINFRFKSIAIRQPDANHWDGEQDLNTGYGMVKKKNLTTEVSNIDGTNSKYSTYSSLSDMIQREVSGINFFGRDIVIQGSENMYGFVHPLIILDGVYLEQLPDIPPSTVKSIEVLKATAGSIYGSRANGGVIIIKTKIQN